MTWINPHQPPRIARRRGRSWVALALLVLILALALVAFFWWSARNDGADETVRIATNAPAIRETTTVPPSETPTPLLAVPADEPPPLISESARAELLARPYSPPMAPAVSQPRSLFLPYTIIPERPRATVIEHIVQDGDTLETIAAQYGLQAETVAWSNPRRYIQVIYPGEKVAILPVDGIYHTVRGRQNIAQIAASYEVEPQDILDSPYNRLATGSDAETVLPPNTRLIVPGGVGEAIIWRPTVVLGAGAGSSSNQSGWTISFEPGHPGSCGTVVNPGGGLAWVRPLRSYTFVRGFSLYHGGVDLAGVVGAPILAANSGRVIFAGWNNYGYGYMIALAHGPTLTLYGHLSEIHVRCRQDVAAGQVIGGLGNTGNSSGPHLHFEIRDGQNVPQNPAYTIGF